MAVPLNLPRHLCLMLCVAASGLCRPSCGQDPAAESAVSFNRDIRPLLAAHCLACHGPDDTTREAGLRLDERQEAIDFGALVPGDADASELVARIFSEDPETVMPPPRHHKPLKPEQKKLLQRWIQQGADYEQHWAFVPPQLPTPPANADHPWVRNEIDRLVLARMQQQGWEPAPPADRYTLVRRLYLDLIGLPPTPEQADAFVHSQDPQAYGQLVDQLLASPRFGERWAQPWLDLARYSDTNGYEKDRPRSIWPYRDWVIDAFNADLPYDQFTIQQLAGDMLPQADNRQRTATGFHRNTMLNEEGGIDPLEYRFLSMVDRVSTTGTVWLGLTVGCAQCHTHKYDPITQRDYYRLMALLDNADEPDLQMLSGEQQQRRDELLRQIEQQEAALAGQFPPEPDQPDTPQSRAAHLDRQWRAWADATAATVADWRPLRLISWETNLPRLESLEDDSILASGDITKRDWYQLTLSIPPGQEPLTGLRLEAIADERLPGDGPGRTYYEGRKGDFFVSELTVSQGDEPLAFTRATTSAQGQQSLPPEELARRVADGDGSSGWLPGGQKGESLEWVLVFEEPLPAPSEGTTLQVRMLFERHYAVSLGRFRWSVTTAGDPQASQLPEPIQRDLVAWRERRLADPQSLQRFFLRTTELLQEARKPIERLRSQLPSPITTMVFQERPEDHPRTTHVHHRGEYLQPTEPVSPGMMAVLLEQTPEAEQPRNRLELARWLVGPHNPLAARVAVNRFWRELFGAGLVRSDGDFGVQSPPPTHPLLLDWLAVRFQQQGWSTKQLLREIVTSATYQQTSLVTGEAYQRDPENHWLARGPRFRLPAEMVRDSLLQASGLLSGKMYGPGVRPPQPASVTALAYGNPAWQASEGEDRFRRSIYTFKKRTAAFAAYTVFDAGTGETCLARRNRSNTPLQALTLLNDTMFLEMAQALGQRAARETSGQEQALELIFRSVLTRPPRESEHQAIMAFYQQQRQRLEDGQLDAAAIAGQEAATPEAAAWVLVARAIMNLDEAIVKP